MAATIPMNYLRGIWKKEGKLPEKYRHLESSFRNGTAGAGTVPPLTAAQEKAVREAIGSLPAAGAGNPDASYAGADFQSMVEQLRERKGMSYSDAYCAVIKTPAGQQAHRAFLKAKNPGIVFEE
jgi:hypothetical protein